MHSSLCGGKRVSVSRTPGHTKRFQTVPLINGLRLLDCPGIVFPRRLHAAASPAAAVRRSDVEETKQEETKSMIHGRAVQEVCGVIPLAQVREPYSALRVVAEAVPLWDLYGIKPLEVRTYSLPRQLQLHVLYTLPNLLSMYAMPP